MPETTQPPTLTKEPPDGALVAALFAGSINIDAVYQRSDVDALGNTRVGRNPEDRWFQVGVDVDDTDGPWAWADLPGGADGEEPRPLVRLYCDWEASR